MAGIAHTYFTSASSLTFRQLSTVFLAWSLGKSITIAVLLALMVLAHEVVFLQALDPAGCFSFEVLKAHESGVFGVVI